MFIFIYILVGYTGVFAQNLNLEGTALQACSQANEATTGWHRDGKCTEGENDQGSHHICVDLHHAQTADGNFCSLTGQSNWCDELQDGKPRVHWCICQWAFNSFLNADGTSCDDFDVKCDATNNQARIAYGNNPDYAKALECLNQKCPPQADENAVNTGVATLLKRSTATKNEHADEAQSSVKGFNPLLAGAVVLLLIISYYSYNSCFKAKNQGFARVEVPAYAPRSH